MADLPCAKMQKTIGSFFISNVSTKPCDSYEKSLVLENSKSSNSELIPVKSIGKTLVKTVQEWNRDIRFSGGWLRYESVDGIYVDLIFCEICRAYPVAARNGVSKGGRQIDADKYINGTRVVKKYNAALHSQGGPHINALKASKAASTLRKDKPIIKTLAKLNEKTLNKMKKLFNWAYYLAKEELPFTLFPSLLIIEKKHGVDVGQTYHNDKHAKEFMDFIADEEKKKTALLLKNSIYFSALFDGSTDKASEEKQQLYIRLVKDGEAQMRFIG